MVREILFRAKRLDNDEWVMGFYMILGGKYHYILTGKLNIICGYPDLVKYQVDPATVGQYTGMKDKHGKRIFEGDLLDGFQYPFFREENNAHNYFAEVVWFDDSPAFGLVTHRHPLSAVRGISAGNAEYMEEFAPNNWEVIGNIHDNPELIGGGEDG